MTMEKPKRKGRPKKPKLPVPPLKSWLYPKIRNLSRIWPGKNEAKKLYRVQVQIGYYKNGKPKFKFQWKCAKCLNLFDEQQVEMDHIQEVVPVETGFTNWEDYITRTFVQPDGYQCLCKACHKEKTDAANQERKIHRDARKAKSTTD